ncbi:sensor histidine kinase [Rhodococcus jostii]|uniref:histidine kinase n=1 Tax=Rhodococcus jostii TaxID=132919 RepID=A0ABU4CP26_RHOJO|nr:ATP-binding protein [Rhodococcus jostii]MDV6285062.1 ATP-binding protein [Rhodococcus jostii]
MTSTPTPVVGLRRRQGLRRKWGVEGWPLRWKMATVLTVPLMVAVGLGSLRVHENLSAATDFAAIADRLTMVPLLVELDADAAAVMGTLAQRSITPAIIDGLDQSIAAVDRARGSAALDQNETTHLTAALAGARALSAQAKQGPTQTASLTEQLASIRAALSGTVSAITQPIADPDVALETGRLEDLWAAQKLLSAEGLSVVAASAILSGESGDTLDDQSAELRANLRTESAMIDQLAQRYPPEDPAVEVLRTGVAERTTLVRDVPRPERAELVLTDLKNSLFVSIDDYSRAVAETSAGLADAVANKSDMLRASAWRDSMIVGALLLTAIALAVIVAGSLLTPLRRLRHGALEVAHTSLPAAVERLRTGTETTIPAVDPIDVHTHEEVGQVARAIDDMHSQALRLAGEQAQLRLQMNNVFEALARRSRSLIDLQLDMIEQLEFEERDPKRLDNLFRLDHLATRMRRNGDNLLILAGTENRRGRPAPILLGDAVRASISEVENYQRVHIGAMPPVTLAGAAGHDLVHILAELFDNALHFSPPDSGVTTRCARTIDGGLVLDIIDHGIGISPHDLDELNHRIAATPQVTPDTARHMGLYVVSELATRHHISVALRPTLDRTRNAGITATVHLPADLLTAPLDDGPHQNTGRDPGHDESTQREGAPRESDHTIQAATVAPVQPELTPPHHRETVEANRPIPGALPQRRPGASNIAAAPARHQSMPTNDPPPTGTPPRHLLDPTRTATFFQRPGLHAASLDPPAHTPIFASIAPLWLTDPTSTHDPQQQWVTQADPGWAAAARATHNAATAVTASGLPQRVPGQRQVPGGVTGAGRSPTPRRTPDTIRANLTRHHNGIRAGRASTQPAQTSPANPENLEEV